jgi:hypothetical protein
MNGLAIGAGEYFFVGVRKLHQYYAKKTTWVLEIQYGEECKEDDIVRI